MTEHEEPKADLTADFLADVRPEETPWRVDRPAEVAEATVPEAPGRPEKWRRTKIVGRVAGQAAPYVQAAALIGWLASDGFDDS
jgi:hypothetical protein